MPRAAPPLTSFNSGEWSPRMQGRVDLDRYGSACSVLENFLPTVQGGVVKRSGTRFVREPTPQVYSPEAFSEIFDPQPNFFDTQARTGYGFQPKFALVYSVQNSTTTTGIGRADLLVSMGFVTASKRVAYFSRSKNANAVTESARGCRDDAVIASVDSLYTGLDGKTDAFMTSDGITFRCMDAYSAGTPNASVWAAGEGTITNAEIVTFDSPAAPGQFSVQSGLADADFVFLLANGCTTMNTVQGVAASQLSFGAFDGERQFVSSYFDSDGADPSVAGRCGSTDRCVSLGVASGTISASTQLRAVSLEEGRLTLDCTVALGGRKISALFVSSGGSLKVRNFATPAGTGVFTPITDLPGTPRGTFVASASTPDSTSYVTTGSHLSLCGASNATSARVQALAIANAAATTECAYRVSGTSTAWSYIAPITAPAVGAEIDFSTVSASSYTFNCTTALAGQLVSTISVCDVYAPGTPVLVPFAFNEDDAYALEFGPGYVSAYRDSQPLFEDPLPITGATAASPVVITSIAHGLANGDEVYIDGVLGMGELNGRFFEVAGAAADTFALSEVDGSAYTAYSGSGSVRKVWKLVSPYDAEDLQTLDWAGQNDVLYIACASKPPMKLSRFGELDWTLEEVAFDYFPFAPENKETDSYVSASAATGSVTLTSSEELFVTGSVGSYIKLREVIEANNVKWAESTNFADFYEPWVAGASIAVGERCYHEDKVYELVSKHGDVNTGKQPPVHEEGYGYDGSYEWKFVNYGFGYARITAVTDAHRATATVVVPMPLSSVSVDVAITSTTAANPVEVTATSHGFETGDKVFLRGITTADELNDQVYEVTRTGVNTFTVPVNGTTFGAGTGGVAVLFDSSAQANGSRRRPKNCTRWSWGAWDVARGYPRAVLFFEDRLLWASTASNPQTVWASVTGDYEDHRTFDEDDSALVFTLATSGEILWLRDQGALVLGTSDDESGTPRNAAEPLAPGTVSTIRTRSRYGTRRGVRPVGVENVLLVAQRAGRKLRELRWDDAEDALAAADLTRLADHVTLPIIAGMDFAGEPDRLLWCYLEDGSLVALTYERDEEVVGWHRHPLGGTAPAVRGIAVIPHPDGDGDQVWLVVERTVGGERRTWVEFLEKQWVIGTELANAYYVDAGGSYEGAPVSSVRAFHLAGETVRVMADGVDAGEVTVSELGDVALPAAASAVHVGYGYAAVLETLNLEAGAADGTAQGKLQRVTRAVVRLLQTSGKLEYGPRASALRQAHRVASGTLYDGDTPVLSWPAGNERGARIALRHESPLPATVLAIFPSVTTTD